MTAESISNVLALTQDMMLCVIEERWDALVEMQVRQDEILKQLFSSDGPVFSKVEKDDLFEVQRLNQEIILAAENHRADIANELSAMRKGKAKAGAYQSL